MIDYHNTVNEKPQSLELCAAMDFVFITAPPNSPLSSIEEPSSPLFCGLDNGFTVACMCPVQLPAIPE